MVMNGDIMTQVNFQQFLEFHLSHADKATMGVRKYQNIIPYGVVKSEGQQLLSIQEKPVQNHFVNAGVYMLNPEVIDMIPAKSYYDMPTLFQMLLNKKENVNVFPIHEYWLDIGRIDDFERAHQDYPKIFL
jgi:NDP-sugar pyrophosphorylase family protein